MDDSTRAKRYHRAGRILGVAGFGVDLVLLFLLIFAGWSLALRTLAERMTSFPTLSVLIYLALFGLILEVPGLPLGYVIGYWLEHRYGLSNLTFGAWVKDQLKGMAVGGGLTALGVEFV